MQQLTKIVLAWELFGQGVPKVRIADQLAVHRETVHLWVTGIQAIGVTEFLARYTQAKTGPRPDRQVDPVVKRWVWDIREREHDCCGQKVQYFLQREQRCHLSVPKIYEIIKEKYTVKSKWKHTVARGPVPVATTAREVLQFDTVDYGAIFAFTGLDICSREADVLLRPSLTSHDGLQFLETAMARRFDGFVELIQTDGGSEFKDEFTQNIHRFTNRHRVARPYKKNEQSYIESFNRTLRKECLGWGKYRRSQLNQLTPLVDRFLDRYHYHRPHMGLGMRPPLIRKP